MVYRICNAIIWLKILFQQNFVSATVHAAGKRFGNIFVLSGTILSGTVLSVHPLIHFF